MSDSTIEDRSYLGIDVSKGYADFCLMEEDGTVWKALYDRLTDRGKHHMLAMTACMRKLLCIAYGCWCKEEPFDPTYEKRLKARQAEKQPTGDTSNELALVRARTCRPQSLEKRQRKGGRPPRQRRALALQRMVKGPSSKRIITVNLLLSKLDNQLGILISA